MCVYFNLFILSIEADLSCAIFCSVLIAGGLIGYCFCLFGGFGFGTSYIYCAWLWFVFIGNSWLGSSVRFSTRCIAVV